MWGAPLHIEERHIEAAHLFHQMHERNLARVALYVKHGLTGK
jgi:hypothetical protein